MEKEARSNYNCFAMKVINNLVKLSISLLVEVLSNFFLIPQLSLTQSIKNLSESDFRINVFLKLKDILFNSDK